MSEYVDFHYMPLEGKITGKQVLKQTEDAINDLGNKVYSLDIDQSEIDEAIEKSNEAINTANSALSAVTTGRSVWFNNVAEMVATDIEAGVTAETKGYYVANDGGNALYLIRQEKSGDVVDGGSLIALDNGNMAELVTDGTVNVKQFGAIGNGTDDDTTVFQNTSSYAQANGFVPFVGVATYKITSNITGTFNSFGEVTITGGGTVDIINLHEVVSDVSDIRDEVVDETASAKAYSESAETSATNASNSASSASTTATQLMEYLEDKEELTAPAVDPTLTITGAAADAKVTGDEFSDVKSALTGRTHTVGNTAIENIFSMGNPTEATFSATNTGDTRYYWGITFKQDFSAVEIELDLSSASTGYTCEWKRYTNNTGSTLVDTDTLFLVDIGKYTKGDVLPLLNVKTGECIVFETEYAKVKQVGNSYVNIAGIKISDNTLSVPNNYQLGCVCKFYTEDNAVSDSYKTTKTTVDDIAEFVEYVPEHISPNIFDKDDADIITGGYIAPGGSVVSNSVFWETGYLPCSYGDTVRCQYEGEFLTNGGITIAVYDSTKTYLQNITDSLDDINVSVASAAYIRIPFNTTVSASKLIVTKNDTTLYPQYIPYGLIEKSCGLVDRVEALEESADIHSQWYSKNCVCIGDSIMWYDGHELGTTGVIAVGYPTYLHDILGLTVNNQGVSGACVAYHEERVQTDNVTIVDSIDFGDYDLAILEGGVNDYITGSPIGSIVNSGFDKTTFYGAYQYIIEKILTDNPTIQIVMFTPYKVAWGTAGQYPLSTYIEAIENIADRYAIPLVDLYKRSGFNRMTYGTNPAGGTYTIDGLHSNNPGYKRLNDILISVLRGLGSVSQRE